jgi:CRISPR-associated protein Csb2
MAIWLEQTFWMGRFHATRWKESPFEDRYGEWPPSPWRMLRALAARWFQYSRETGDEDAGRRHGLLTALARLPEFYLPAAAWRGPVIKQYQPIDIGWSDKAKKAPAVKEPGKTLVADTFWCLPHQAKVIWTWPDADLTAIERQLFQDLAARVLYFGRAESPCKLRLLDAPPGCPPNCKLQKCDTGRGVPVLVVKPGTELREEVLLSPTGAELLANRRIPPGTAWYYAVLPERPKLSPPVRRINKQRMDNFVQYAVGGRVYPPASHWVRLTEKVRGAAIKHLACTISSDHNATYRSLTREQRDSIKAFTGKDGEGNPLKNHEQCYWLLWPNEESQPERLIVWRKGNFEQDELDALWRAADQTYGWLHGAKEDAGWSVRIVPLPESTPLPRWFIGSSKVWESATPFVIPAQRHTVRRNGKQRPNEKPERVVEKLLIAAGLRVPTKIELLEEMKDREWVKIHGALSRQAAEHREPGRFRPGYRMRITFPDSVNGPLILGDSAHFGVGVFRAIG